MEKLNPKVDAFIGKDKQWREAFEALRAILLESELTEEFKWGKPCYTLDGKNILLIHGFKHYCAILFMKGALLKDAEGVLVSQTENTQATRQMRFTSAEKVNALAPVIRAYVQEVVAVEKMGLKVDFKETTEYPVPEEFQLMLDEIPELREAFEALTPGRQRGYLLYFSQAKQSKTRAARVEKMMDRIFEGKGLNDR